MQTELTYATVTASKRIHGKPNRSQSGYGRKLNTDLQVQLKDETLWRTVYAICYGNASSHYVLKYGKMLFIRDGEINS